MTNEISSDVPYLISQLNRLNENENQLKIFYNNEQVQWQNSLTKEETKDQPIIEINHSTSNKTLVMIDPDAPSADQPITGPFIHWIKANFKGRDANDGQTICEYMGPGPRPGTGRHRYMFLLYQSNGQVKGQEDQTFDEIPKRRKFQLEKFVQENQLELIDINLFYVDA